MAACGTGFIPGCSKGRTPAERQVVKLFIDRGQGVNAADDYGITAPMVAANIGRSDHSISDRQGRGPRSLRSREEERRSVRISIEPLMPIDYAIGVGTFRPNNAIVFNEDAVKLASRVM